MENEIFKTNVINVTINDYYGYELKSIYIGDSFYNIFINKKWYCDIDLDNFEMAENFYDVSLEEQAEIVENILKYIFDEYYSKEVN